MAKRWKKEDLTYLKRYAKRKRLAELAERFRTDFVTVRSKLIELGLTAIDIDVPPPDPALGIFEQGLVALHEQKWINAAKLFERVLEEGEHSDVRDRARQYLVTCRERLAVPKSAAGEDPFLQALFEKNRGNFETVLALCGRGGRQSKDDRFAYLAACVYSLSEEYEEAARWLGVAIELEPKNRIQARHDTDLTGLEAQSEYTHIFRPPGSPN